MVRVREELEGKVERVREENGRMREGLIEEREIMLKQVQ